MRDSKEMVSKLAKIIHEENDFSVVSRIPERNQEYGKQLDHTPKEVRVLGLDIDTCRCQLSLR